MSPAAFTFFFPYRPVGGVPVLFGRLARALAARGHACRVVDYHDGALAKSVQGAAGVELLAFEDGRPIEIGPEGVLVMQAILPATMRSEMRVHPDMRVLFWVLHVMNLVQVVLPWKQTRDWQARSLFVQRAVNRTVLRVFQSSLKAFVRDLARARSLVFMDGSTWRGTQERLEVDLPRAFVPVTLDVPQENPRARARTGAPLHAGWLGRLDDFKVEILNHTIGALAREADRRGQPIEMRIIGDGPLAGHVRTSPSLRLTVVRAGTVMGAELTRQLASLDVLFAMGTSALEGASLGVPTVLLDFAYGPIPADYRYRWLFDAQDYELGRLIDASLRGEPSDASLARILEEVTSDPATLSDRCFDYCRRQHSLESGVETFLNAAGAASFRFGDIDPRLRRKSWLRRGYESLRVQA